MMMTGRVTEFVGGVTYSSLSDILDSCERLCACVMIPEDSRCS